MATDTEYAWAAGFIEADGCIHLSYQQSRTAYKVEVIIVQKDRRPLDRLQRIFENHSTIGVVRRRGGTATYYRLTFSSHRAETLLLAILPYLDHKRDVALLGLGLLAQVRLWGGARGQGVRLPDEEHQSRLRLITSARRLSGDAERLSEAAPAKQIAG